MRTPPGFLLQLVFCKKTVWFIGVEVEQETSALPPKKKTWIRACPELALIGLSSGTGPRAEGSTSDEDRAELTGTFLSVANR